MTIAGNPGARGALQRDVKAISILVVLGACSPYSVSGPTTPPVLAAPRPEVATVCVVRSSVFARAVTFVIHDNQTLVGATRGDSYFCYEAEPGLHAIVSDTFDPTDRAAHVDVVLTPNTRYWLAQEHANHLGSVTSRLRWLDAPEAAALLAHADYRVVTATPAHEQPPPPVPYVLAAR